ncbi:MAG TPA: hypothetical protein VGR25_07495 [bacterium]|nr:hypothetical protein [bacterium]
MTETLLKFGLIAAGAGAFTGAMIGETAPEIVGALAGAFVGALLAVTALSLPSSPLSLSPGAALDAAVTALWFSALSWLAVVWWEALTGRLPPTDAKG